MNKQTDIFSLLEKIPQPGFCVKDSVIQKCNRAALGLLLEEGTPVTDLILQGEEDYIQLGEDSCLSLSLSLEGCVCTASVSRIGSYDVFLLDTPEDSLEFQAIALAAQELRKPLSTVLRASEKLLERDDPDAQELSRGLHRLLRIVRNMSDAGQPLAPHRELQNLTALFDGVFEKAGTLLSTCGILLEYEGLPEDIYSLADEQQLERALLNLISNAAKFSPEGEPIRVTVTRQGRRVCCQIINCGSGISEHIRQTLFQRYLRTPSLEDPRHGIGLGMVLARNAACSHGGVILVDRTKDNRTRISMNLPINQSDDCSFHSPALRIDTLGGYDAALIELSDILPNSLYGYRS